MSEPTTAQLDYVRALQHQLRLPDRLLDTHCVRTYGCLFRELNRREMSTLIDTLKGWEAIPAELQRINGQIDLPGLEGAA